MIIDIIIFAAGIAIFSYIIKDAFFKKEKTHALIVPVVKMEPIIEPVAPAASVTPELKTVTPKRKYGGKVKKTKSGMLGRGE